MKRQILLLIAAFWCSRWTPAIEVTEPEGAAHGYPAWCDIDGKNWPKPFFKPMLVTVKISHAGLQRMKMAGRFYQGDQFIIHPEIPAIAKVFVRVPDTKVWLTTPRPGGFLRYEGPIVLPTDPLVGVDLVSDGVSGPAEPVEEHESK